MYRERLSKLPENFCPYEPFPSAEDRAFWDGIDPAAASNLVAAAVNRRGFKYPALPASLFLDFTRTGNRSRFEERYFARRRALNDFVLAECAAADGRFLDGVIDGLDALCSECGWQLPAHNSYIRDTPQLPLPAHDRPVLDLFACETGAQLALATHLLKTRLDAVSPFIYERVRSLIQERIITPYLSEHFWWMGRGDEPMNNWTPWCTQNVLIAAGLADLPDATMRAIIEKAAESLDFFLKDYGDDGCCSEGAQYYRHAGLCLFGAAEILDSLAPGVFAPLYAEPKIRNIALYVRNVYVGNGYYINFADCSPIAGPAGAREFLFGKRIASRDLMTFAARDFMEKADQNLTDEINLFYRIQSIAAIGEIGAYAASGDAQASLQTEACPAALQPAAAFTAPQNAQPTLDIWYPSVGLLIARSRSLCLAVKAGGNDDSHNHNDTGSFTLYKNGKPCLIDIGVETYTAKTFSPRRYEIWTMQSDWHNLPTLGGCMQEAGKEYAAREVNLKTGSDETALSMELAGAWNKESRVSSYRRTVTLFKKMERVSVEDRYSGTGPAVLNLITEARPEPTQGGIKIGKLAFAALHGATGNIEIDEAKITDPRLALAWKDCVYRIRIPFGESISLTIE